MDHFKWLKEDQILIWNSWQQLKQNWWKVRKNKVLIGNTQGQAIKAQNVFWNTYCIIFKCKMSIEEQEIRSITAKNRSIDLKDQRENEIP